MAVTFRDARLTGNASQDATPILKRLIAEEDDVRGDGGTYSITAPLDFTLADQMFVLPSNCVIKLSRPAPAVYRFMPSCDRAWIEGGTVDSNNFSDVRAIWPGFMVQGMTRGHEDVTIKGVTSRNPGSPSAGAMGDAFYLHGRTRNPALTHKRTRVLGCRAHTCRRQGMSIIGGYDFLVDDFIAYDVTGLPGAGIDIEPDNDIGSEGWCCRGKVSRASFYRTVKGLYVPLPGPDGPIYLEGISGAIYAHPRANVFLNGRRLANYSGGSTPTRPPPDPDPDPDPDDPIPDRPDGDPIPPPGMVLCDICGQYVRRLRRHKRSKHGRGQADGGN